MNQQQRRAVAIGLVIAVGLYLMQASQKKKQEGEQATASASAVATPTPQVVMQACLYAKRDLPRFTRISRESIPLLLDRREVPTPLIPPGAATEFAQVANMVVVEDVHRREPILLSRLARPEEVMGVSQHIAPGKRAVSVRIEDVKAVGGFVGQGDIVDIIGTFTVPADVRGVGGTLTRFVMQKVKVLAINTLYKPATQGPEGASPSPGGSAAAPSPQGSAQDVVSGQKISIVTFEVSPDDAEKLVELSETARLYLVLRSPLDEDEAIVEPIDDERVYIEKPKQPAVPKRDIVIYKGRQPQIISVKVESVVPGTKATDVYYQDQQPIISKPRPEDFQMLMTPHEVGGGQ